MSNIFLTGCTHFGHAKIIRLCNRPFADVDEMDNTLVQRWNARVGPDDIVYHLGDVTWKSQDKRLDEVLGALNGRKHLIHGNHDPLNVQRHPSWTSSQAYLFERELAPPAGMVLYHYPIEEWYGFYHGSVHVHAHTHSVNKRWARQDCPVVERRVNVTVEAWGYAPAPLDEVLDVWRR